MKGDFLKLNQLKGSNTLLKLFCCMVIIVVICILIGNYAFKNGNLTCDHYVLNTYLYIILAILLVFMVILLNDQFGIFNSVLNMLFQLNPFIGIIVILVLIIGLTIAINYIDPTNILLSNLVWLLLILLIGLLIIPTILFARLTQVTGLAGLLTIVIVIITGLLGYYFGDKIITFNWDKYLLWALGALIVVSIFGPYFITTAEGMIQFYYGISIAGLIIFVLLLLSNHKRLKENADKCIDGKMVPNYPLESYRIFIKIVNVFQDLVRILGMRRLNRSRFSFRR
jgi:hypothetical protein